MKSDVYSFGVLVLEITSGRKNSSFHERDGSQDLATHAWRLWCEETNKVPIILGNCHKSELVRCMRIGLLCVQEDPLERPTMPTIFVMLTINTVTLPLPRQPGFFCQSRKTHLVQISLRRASMVQKMIHLSQFNILVEH